MASIRHPEWRNSHEPTKFPFSQRATLQNEAGDVILEGTFLDASFYPVGGKENMYLSKVLIESDTVTIYVGDADNAARAAVTFDLAAPPDNLHFVDSYGRPAGLMVSEAVRLAIFASWSTGEHVFAQTDTPLVARCCAPTPDIGFRGFELASGEIVTGDIWLVGDNGVVLTCEQTTPPVTDCGETATPLDVIRIDIVGDPLYRRRLCSTDGLFETPRFLRQLLCCSPAQSAPTVAESTPAPAEVDILLLFESTRAISAFLALSGTRDMLSDFVTETTAALPTTDIQWGVADYRDVEDGGDYAANSYALPQAFTDDTGAITAAIAALVASGGNDYPQQQLDTLVSLAADWTTSISGRSAATKLLVWIGVSPGWSGLAKGHTYETTSSASAALTAAGIRVIALNVDVASAGLDLNSQAFGIAGATGGVLQNNAWYLSQSTIKAYLTGAVESLLEQPVGGIVVPAQDQTEYLVSPNTAGNIEITVGSNLAADTVLRVRAVPEGMIIEAVGELLGDM